MDKFYAKINKYYELGLYSDEDVEILFEAEFITEDQKEAILSMGKKNSNGGAGKSTNKNKEVDNE